MKDLVFAVIRNIKVIYLFVVPILCNLNTQETHQKNVVLSHTEAISVIINYLVDSQNGAIYNSNWPCFVIDPKIDIDVNTSYYYIWNNAFRKYLESNRTSKEDFVNSYLTGDKNSFVELEEIIPLKEKEYFLDKLNVQDHICWEFVSDANMVTQYGKKWNPIGTYSFSPLIPLNIPDSYHVALSISNKNSTCEFLFVLKKTEDSFFITHVYFDDFWGGKGVGEKDYLVRTNYKTK